MLICAILLCAAGLARIVYRYDMYEREPWYLLLLAMALGAAAGWALGYGEDAVLRLFGEHDRSLLVLAAVAGVTEELLKVSIVLAIWFCLPWHFNDPFDGLIYGAMAGLGFAVEESIFYVDMQRAHAPALAIVGQETVRLLLHLLLGGLACVGLGLARFRVPRWPAILFGGMVLAMLIHLSWDYFCGLPTQAGGTSFAQRAISVALMLAALVLFAAAVVTAARRSGEVHQGDRLHTLWGWPFDRLANRRKID